MTSTHSSWFRTHVAPGASGEGFVAVGNPDAVPLKARIRFNDAGGADRIVRVTGREVVIPPGAEVNVPYTVEVAAGAPRAAMIERVFFVDTAPAAPTWTSALAGARSFAPHTVLASFDGEADGASFEGASFEGARRVLPVRLVTYVEDDPEE